MTIPTGKGSDETAPSGFWAQGLSLAQSPPEAGSQTARTREVKKEVKRDLINIGGGCGVGSSRKRYDCILQPFSHLHLRMQEVREP